MNSKKLKIIGFIRINFLFFFVEGILIGQFFNWYSRVENGGMNEKFGLFAVLGLLIFIGIMWFIYVIFIGRKIINSNEKLQEHSNYPKEDNDGPIKY